MSDELAADIRWYAARYPGLSQAEIAKKCGCNQGRVSEVLKGKRS
jgi:predicted XRE-type DNA-binding protein